MKFRTEGNQRYVEFESMEGKATRCDYIQGGLYIVEMNIDEGCKKFREHFDPEDFDGIGFVEHEQRFDDGCISFGFETFEDAKKSAVKILEDPERYLGKEIQICNRYRSFFGCESLFIRKGFAVYHPELGIKLVSRHIDEFEPDEEDLDMRLVKEKDAIRIL